MTRCNARPMFDVAKHLGAITRAVESTTHDGKPAKVVVASRTYPTSPDDLWDAVTDPERIPRWFAAVEGDLRLGGRFQVQGNAGGEIVACDAPTHLALTWEMGGGVSWVDVDHRGLLQRRGGVHDAHPAPHRRAARPRVLRHLRPRRRRRRLGAQPDGPGRARRHRRDDGPRRGRGLGRHRRRPRLHGRLGRRLGRGRRRRRRRPDRRPRCRRPDDRLLHRRRAPA